MRPFPFLKSQIELFSPKNSRNSSKILARRQIWRKKKHSIKNFTVFISLLTILIFIIDYLKKKSIQSESVQRWSLEDFKTLFGSKSWLQSNSNEREPENTCLDFYVKRTKCHIQRQQNCNDWRNNKHRMAFLNPGQARVLIRLFLNRKWKGHFKMWSERRALPIGSQVKIRHSDLGLSIWLRP